MRVSEIFYSIQGEGLRVGHPSVFVRFFGCNFRCPGFGLPPGQFSTEPDEIAKRADSFKSYSELPLAKTGCDSYPSWHPKFAKFSPDMTEEELYEKLSVYHNTDLVLTGGEPLLPGTQRFLLSFFGRYSLDFKTVTFETNGTQLISSELVRLIGPKLILSISPKLRCSGVPRDKAIIPDVIKSLCTHNAYLKFVVSSEEDIGEIESILNETRVKNDVYIMPAGGTSELYNTNARAVCEFAMRKNFIFSPRLHIDLFGNSWGT